jgi:hypothetical protein
MIPHEYTQRATLARWDLSQLVEIVAVGATITSNGISQTVALKGVGGSEKLPEELAALHLRPSRPLRSPDFLPRSWLAASFPMQRHSMTLH